MDSSKLEAVTSYPQPSERAAGIPGHCQLLPLLCTGLRIRCTALVQIDQEECKRVQLELRVPAIF